MRKAHRMTIRTSTEVRDKLKDRAYQRGSESISTEARLILERALGIKRVLKNGHGK